MLVDDDAADGRRGTERPRRFFARRVRHRARAAGAEREDERCALPRRRARRLRVRAPLLLGGAAELARLPFVRLAVAAADRLFARLVPRRAGHRTLARARLRADER